MYILYKNVIICLLKLILFVSKKLLKFGAIQYIILVSSI